MRLLVFETIVARDVAFRRRKKDHAKDSATHCVSLPVRLGILVFTSSRLAKSRPISSAAARSVEKSRFIPSQEYAGSGHLKYPAHGFCHGQVAHSAPCSMRLLRWFSTNPLNEFPSESHTPERGIIARPLAS